LKLIRLGAFFSLAFGYALGCNDSSTRSTTSTDDGGATTTDGGTNVEASLPTECASASTNIDKVVCAANAFNATLTSAQQTTANLLFTDAVGKTKWSNLPGQARSGIQLSALDVTQLAAAKAVALAALSTAGFTDFTGVLAADDYLGTQGGGGGGGPGGGAGYGSGNYYIAFFGTPSATGNWMLQLGGHHMAYNITYLAGVGYPVPNHIGVEPKAEFTVNGATYAPLADEGTTFAAAFKSLEATQLAAAFLSGQTFGDVVVGPVEYAKGTYATASFPAGANRRGVLVSTLTTAQQALVTAAIEQWVRDFDPAVADPLVAAYTTPAAFADTYLAWGGTEASGVDVDVNGTYMRLDGPRLWLEVACQAGVVIQGKSHYHTIYRDKELDYGKSL
jgi:hypothetical protein